MPVWSMSTFTRCAVVPAEGAPILFEHPNSMHRVDGVDVRPMHAWEFYDDAVTHADRFAAEAVAALRELGVDGGRVARRPAGHTGVPGAAAGRSHVGGLLARHPGSARGQDAAGDRAVPAERPDRGRGARGVRGRTAAGHHRARAVRGARRRDASARRRVPGDEHRLLGSEHEPVARRGHRSSDRGRRPRLPRHRHGRDRRVLLLCLADVRVRRRRADARPARDLRGRARVGDGDDRAGQARRRRAASSPTRRRSSRSGTARSGTSAWCTASASRRRARACATRRTCRATRTA